VNENRRWRKKEDKKIIKRTPASTTKKKKKTPRGRHYGGVRCKHEHVLLRSGTSTSAKVAVNSGRKK
jgi:hypothetical protein